ncbi:MAG: glycosyltransferase family 4 protein [Oscillospiraceae bacterium]
MKIAVISSHTPSLLWFRLDMMKAFISNGHSVISIGNEPSTNENNWCEKFAKYNIKYRQIYVERNGKNPFNDIKTYKSIKEVLKQENPDKLFVYQAKTIVYGSMAAKSLKKSEVFSLVAGLGSVFRGYGFKNSIIKFLLKLEYKIACKNSKAVLFQNNDDKSTFLNLNLVSDKKAKIINGSGVNLEKFVQTDIPNSPTFLFIGRLIKDKGILEYLSACQIVKEKYPNIKCLLVGPFDSNPSALKSEELQPFIDKKTIEYFGEQMDVKPFLDKCTVYILPSYHEGTPKTVLEAMATGRAVITTDAPGCRETVVDGQNGFLVPVKDTNVLVQKMIYMIENPNETIRMGTAGRKIAEEKYDVSKVNQSIVEIMEL